MILSDEDTKSNVPEGYYASISSGTGTEYSAKEEWKSERQEAEIEKQEEKDQINLVKELVWHEWKDVKFTVHGF